MRPWLARSGAELLGEDPSTTVGLLSAAQQERGYTGSSGQAMAWQQQVARLREAVSFNAGNAWMVAIEYELLRLEKRIDAVVVTDRCIFCLEFKTTDDSPAALREAEDYALDLHNFHAGSIRHPIVPILITETAQNVPQQRIHFNGTGVLPPVRCSGQGLGELIRSIQAIAPAPEIQLNGQEWLTAPYRPVPTIIEAATMLYARNGVEDIANARADTSNLTRTSAAISHAVEIAQRDRLHTIVFVTGIPGAGKTLCGLKEVFGPSHLEGAAFLTGNAPLVAVLREALARDAVANGQCNRTEANRRVKSALQNVHRFLEEYSLEQAAVAPPEHLIVFDEAQRAWDEDKARRGTQNRPGKLTMSEPAHTLDIMSRHQDWAVIVALIGGGQEINTGEAGLAEWGKVISANGRWKAVAAEEVLRSDNPAQRLMPDQNRPGWLAFNNDLHLSVPLRNINETAAAGWVEAVIKGDSNAAQRSAREAGTLPFFVTRELNTARASLRRYTRGNRRAGIVCSSGAKRLRAEGLGQDVDSGDVPNWFLNSWPDIRASDALEVAATEYACQGLELDVVGLAWGGDLVRAGNTWRTRAFHGDDWRDETTEAHFIMNTYRVLLTRARYETVIWVPKGSKREDPFYDSTRDSIEMDRVAEYLQECGAQIV